MPDVYDRFRDHGDDRRTNCDRCDDHRSTMAPSTTATVGVVAVPDNDDAVRVSQSVEHARRDGVIPQIAELPYFRRVEPQLEVAGDEGMWCWQH